MHSKCQLFIWGLGKSGQLGTGNEHTQHNPQMIQVKSDSKGHEAWPCQVSCGGLYTAIVMSDGEMYTSGCAKYGRLGSGCEDNRSKFVRTPLPQKVKKVSTGLWHGAAVTESSSLIVWGYKKGCGDRLEGKKDCDQPERKCHESAHSVSMWVLPSVCIMPENHKVVGVACGYNYTLAWLSTGVVLSWGSGHHGVLGHGFVGDIASPRPVEALQLTKIMDGAAGYSHSAFVTSDGCLFMCGKGKDGALGLGNKKLADVTCPQQVSFADNVQVVKVSCSVGEHHGHTLALTRRGEVYAWGDGYKGKLGMGSQESLYTPVQIAAEKFDMEHVTEVSAGGIHSAAATAEGSIFTWGCGSDGRLGHPEGQGHRYLFRSDVPRRVEALAAKGRRLAMVNCSYYHTAAIVGLSCPL